MAHADALSRRTYPVNANTQELETQIGLDTWHDVSMPETSDQDAPDIDRIDLSKVQHTDPDCRPIISYLRDKVLPNCDKEARHILLISDQYTLRDGLLLHLRHPKGKDPCTQVVVPKCLR